MKKFLYKFLIVILAFGMLTPSWLAKSNLVYRVKAAESTIIASWSFDASTAVADVDLLGGANFTDGSAGNSASNYVAGNPGTGKAYSNNNWQVDDYYGIDVKTTGYNNIGLSLDYNASATGPTEFKVQYSTDGVSFVDLTASQTSITTSFNATPMKTFDFSGISTVSNNANTEFRLVVTVAGSSNAGTWRVDNIKVFGDLAGDTTKPTVDSVTGTVGTTGEVTTVTVNASDNIVPVAGEISFDSGTTWLAITGNASPFTYDVAVPTDSITSINYSVRVSDAAGNNSDVSNQTIVVSDNDAPTAPVATPVAGDYQTTQQVILSSTDNVTVSPEIYYTLDNSDPADENNLSRVKYAGAAIEIKTDKTLKALAYDEAGNVSGILTAVYGIAPVISTESQNNVSTTSVTITWITDNLATSRVIYDTVSHPILGDAPNYSYAFSTVKYTAKVTNHSVAITGLKPGTKYYYRTVSAASPEAVGIEQSFTTKSLAPVVTAVAVIETPAPQVANPTTPSIVTEEPTTVEQGEIKGSETTETEESEKINWTPWIILFILIILAGAATGGYFYWFGHDEEEEIVSKEVIEKSKKTAVKKPEKTAPKKSKRW